MLKTKKRKMGNRNYINGRAREYKYVKWLKEKMGCEISQRLAGSHSPIDILGVDLKHKKIFFVQCKPKSMSQNKRNKLEDENKLLNGNFECIFMVI